MTAFDLVVVGDANPDVVLAGVPRPLRYGQREEVVERGELVLGGSAAITAAGAARLGLRTAFVGRVGADSAGRFVLDTLTERGVDVSGCCVDKDQLTAMTVVLTAGEDRATLTAPGCLPATDLADIPSRVTAGARYVHVSSYYLQPTLAAGLPAWLEGIRAAGTRTSLDTNDDPTGRWDPAVHKAIAQTDLLLPNEAEALALAGTTDGDVAKACRFLATLTGRPVVKRGPLGALTLNDGELLTVPGVPVEPVDTVGAGDSFNAGLIAGLVNGYDLVDALRLAAACGSLSTRASGGTAAQPTWDEARAAANLP